MKKKIWVISKVQKGFEAIQQYLGLSGLKPDHNCYEFCAWVIGNDTKYFLSIRVDESFGKYPINPTATSSLAQENLCFNNEKSKTLLNETFYFVVQKLATIQ